MRPGGRKANELRVVRIERGFTRTAPGSVLIEMGATRVLCTASVESDVPPFLVGKGRGWLTAEYDMLPGATSPRRKRDRSGKVDGRTVEIQRLIGRSLRNVVRLERLGERTIWLDCDVLDADGGTRTASITGAFIAAVDAVRKSELAPLAPEIFSGSVAAISVGIVEGEVRLDLEYAEDSVAEVDMNLVMTGAGRYIEVQGTGEGGAFSPEELASMLELGRAGVSTLTELQRAALADAWPFPPGRPRRDS